MAEEVMPLLVAHRGASNDAPENTLAAFRLAWEQGADAIEGDFYLTQDGQIVCTHDPSTKRFTNGLVDHIVAESTLEVLRQVDVGAWKDPKWAGERMPTLKEVLDLVPPRKRFLIEIKCGPEIVPKLTEVLGESGVPFEQLRIIAFDEMVIAACREALPEIKAYWLTSYKKNADESGQFEPALESVLATLESCRATGLDTHAHDLIDEKFVKGLRDHGYEFHAWTVDDPAVAKRFRALGVDSLTTNQPAKLRAALTKGLK